MNSLLAWSSLTTMIGACLWSVSFKYFCNTSYGNDTATIINNINYNNFFLGHWLVFKSTLWKHLLLANREVFWQTDCRIYNPVFSFRRRCLVSNPHKALISTVQYKNILQNYYNIKKWKHEKFRLDSFCCFHLLVRPILFKTTVWACLLVLENIGLLLHVL